MERISRENPQCQGGQTFHNEAQKCCQIWGGGELYKVIFRFPIKIIQKNSGTALWKFTVVFKNELNFCVSWSTKSTVRLNTAFRRKWLFTITFFFTTLGPFEWLFSSSTFFLQRGQRSKDIQQKFDGEFFRLVSSTTEKNQTANRVRYYKT